MDWAPARGPRGAQQAARDDEFSDYETWGIGNLDVSAVKTNDMLAGEYAREALKRGLAIEAQLGTNPYKFGSARSGRTRTSIRRTRRSTTLA